MIRVLSQALEAAATSNTPMTYIALARQWRPQTFEQLQGHAVVKQALTRALQENKLHHAYLFTGTRGVGKTSIARLLAKALNCEQGISPTPCLSCTTCISIEKGQFIDLIEIDAASKTKVEEMRTLLENVPYAPSIGRFKIYLIDEVHMLSQHSFNALLKTLEEPPAHVKFLLATTDPQKLPATILSRCLQFHLTPLSVEVITTQIQIILANEKTTAEPAAINLIAEAAKGSMRDALSILEQAMMVEHPHLTVTTVKSILGYTQTDYIPLILKALMDNNAVALLQVSTHIAEEGGHYPYVLETLLHAFHTLAKSPYLSQSSTALEPFTQAFPPEMIQLFYQITLKSLEDLPITPHPRIGFEMALLRLLSFQPATKHVQKALQKIDENQS